MLLAACVLGRVPPAFGQDAPLTFAPTGTFIAYGWSEDQTLVTFLDLRADGFLFRGFVEGDRNHGLARAVRSLAGDTVASLGWMYL